MAWSQWWAFTPGMVTSDRNEAGVYEFGNSNGTIVYVGSSNDVKRRLQEHLGEDAKTCIKKNAAQYRIEYRTDYKTAERAYYDEIVRVTGRPPLCNDVRP